MYNNILIHAPSPLPGSLLSACIKHAEARRPLSHINMPVPTVKPWLYRTTLGNLSKMRLKSSQTALLSHVICPARWHRLGQNSSKPDWKVSHCPVSTEWAWWWGLWTLPCQSLVTGRNLNPNCTKQYYYLHTLNHHVCKNYFCTITSTFPSVACRVMVIGTRIKCAGPI